MALAAAERSYDLIGQLTMPQRLRDVGIAKTMLPQLAEGLLLSKAVKTNPKPIVSTKEAYDYLEKLH